MSRSKVIKNKNFSWEGIERKEYKTETTNFKDIHRYSLLGDETSDLNIHTRYFEVQPGGYSSLEQHRHPHSVVIIRGNGSVILDDEIIPLNQYDVVYVAPNSIHQFHADNNEPLGFLCMVDRYRDKPVIPDEDTLAERISSKKVLKKIRK